MKILVRRNLVNRPRFKTHSRLRSRGELNHIFLRELEIARTKPPSNIGFEVKDRKSNNEGEQSTFDAQEKASRRYGEEKQLRGD